MYVFEKQNWFETEAHEKLRLFEQLISKIVSQTTDNQSDLFPKHWNHILNDPISYIC